MTVAKNADVVNVREALVAEVVQRELAASAKLSGLFNDYSALVGAGGSSEIKIPRASSFSVLDRDNATPTEGTASHLTFDFDKIILNKNKYVYYVIPGQVEIDAKPSYELTAAERAASAHGRSIDVSYIDALWTGADEAKDIDFQSGVTDFESTILSMIEAADVANMPDDGNRFIIIKPQERKLALGVANFVQADRYGDRTPLVSGELGQVYGCRFVVLNQNGVDTHAVQGGAFGNGKMMLVHRESVGIAFNRMPIHDSEKAIRYGAGSMAHTWDVNYGIAALQNGELIIRAWNLP